MKKIGLILLCAVLLTGCTPEDLFSLMARSDVEQAASQAVEKSGEVVSALDEKINNLKKEYQDVTKLESLKSTTDYAYAFKTSSSNGSKIKVIAVLPPKDDEGVFYQVWLMNQETRKIESIGTLVLNQEDSTRELLVDSKIDFTGYGRVMISSEKVVDQKAEDIILAGEFKI